MNKILLLLAAFYLQTCYVSSINHIKNKQCNLFKIKWTWKYPKQFDIHLLKLNNCKHNIDIAKLSISFTTITSEMSPTPILSCLLFCLVKFTWGAWNGGISWAFFYAMVCFLDCGRFGNHWIVLDSFTNTFLLLSFLSVYLLPLSEDLF